MARFSLIRNPVTNWTNGSAVLASEANRFETNLAQAINGDDGGCWAPVAGPITIGNAGLYLGISGVGGDLRVTRGGTVSSSVTSGTTAWQCNDGDYPLMSTSHAGRKRVVSFPVARGYSSPGYIMKTRREDYAAQCLAPTWNASTGGGAKPVHILVPFRAHDTATVGQVTLNFRVVPHTTLPTSMLMMRVVRSDPFGNSVLLTSQAAGADSNGYVAAARPASPDAWYAGGAAQTLVVPCDQNNVVDVSQYAYYVEIVEESGATAVAKAACKVVSAFGNISLSGLATHDNVSMSNGDRILVISQSDPTQNGIWITNSASWSRAPDLQTSADFFAGFVTLILQGDTYSGSIWAADPRITSWTPGTTQLLFTSRGQVSNSAICRGNILQSFSVEFDNILDTRWE